MEEANDLLSRIVKAMVDRPEDVYVDIIEGDHSLVAEIHVHESDVGKAIGYHGVYAKSLREIFGAIYGKLGKRILLEVISPNRRRR